MSEEGRNQLDPCGILESSTLTKLAASICIYCCVTVGAFAVQFGLILRQKSSKY